MQFGSDILERLVASPEGIRRVEPDGFEWTMTYQDFMGRADRPMGDYASAIKKQGKVKLLCLHGRGDTTIPWEESRQCAALTGGELSVVDGDHNYRNPQHAQQMIDQVIEFCLRDS